MGQESVTQACISEIAPGQASPPFHMALDEAFFVLDGHGVASVWGSDESRKISFEWQRHSLFLIPGNYTYRLYNAHGSEPLRLLHFNYLPLAMKLIPFADTFFSSTAVDSERMSALNGQGAFAAARPLTAEDRASNRVQSSDGWGGNVWIGNLFPDLDAWQNLQAVAHRGATQSVAMVFPGSPLSSHMSVFEPGTYKKAHRHAAGVVIVVISGEGYSLMWREGEAKNVIPWRAGSAFSPPNRWFHQHFNVGAEPARYLALHVPRGMSGYSQRPEYLDRDQIELTAEDPWVRETFESELAKRSLRSLMPQEAYVDKHFDWSKRKKA